MPGKTKQEIINEQLNDDSPIVEGSGRGKGSHARTKTAGLVGIRVSTLPVVAESFNQLAKEKSDIVSTGQLFHMLWIAFNGLSEDQQKEVYIMMKAEYSEKRSW